MNGSKWEFRVVTYFEFSIVNSETSWAILFYRKVPQKWKRVMSDSFPEIRGVFSGDRLEKWLTSTTKCPKCALVGDAFCWRFPWQSWNDHHGTTQTFGKRKDNHILWDDSPSRKWKVTPQVVGKCIHEPKIMTIQMVIVTRMLGSPKKLVMNCTFQPFLLLYSICILKKPCRIFKFEYWRGKVFFCVCFFPLLYLDVPLEDRING